MTELIWEGKYKDGKKTAPVRIALPFQTIETVNESTEDRKKTLDMFAQGKTAEWRNRLIWGDKKYVLPSLLQEFAGKVNLIYIDPPFNVGADFSFTATIPDNPETEEDETTEFVKQPNIIEQKAYRDTWGRGNQLDSYLQWFYDTIILLRELLAENGSIYVHLDWHVGHYAKAVLDEVFGYENFRNEIIWHYRTGNLAKNQFQRKHDTIFFYSNSEEIEFFPQEIKEYYAEIYGPNFKPSFEGRKQGKDERGLFRMSMIDDVWDISAVFTLSNEHLPYDTQKPEVLLERIIKASSNEGDLVMDCFCGSGTTAAVAEKLNRRWIACDLGRFAIHTTRKRLLQIPNLKPFIVQNLGKYERQAWQVAEFLPQPPPPSPAVRRGVNGEEEKKEWYPVKISEEMLERARELRKKQTPAEDILWETLRNRKFENLKFRRQHVIESFIVDFYCAEHKLVLEIDGSIHAEKNQKEYDTFRQKVIEELGVRVLRFTNEEVINHLDRVLEKIMEAISPLQTGEGFGVREEQAIKEKAYRKFILDLYHADEIKGYNWLHGSKSKRMVHVGAIDSPVSLGDVKSIIQEFWKSVGRGDSANRPTINGIDVLGWEFAFDINETAKQQAASNNVDMKFKKIPRDAMDKRAVEQGDIHFFELAGLDVKAKIKKQQVELSLKDFVIPPDDVPEEVQKSITHWSQWIDYWAVDWNYREDTFHNEWQSYRTKKNPNIVLETSHLYETRGKYTIIVKVIDILGNDTTKALQVEVR